jgi:glutaredoxin
MIEVFTSPACVKCKQLKTLLDADSIIYILSDISSSIEKKNELIDLNLLSLPVIKLGNDYINGISVFTLMKSIKDFLKKNR